MSRLSTPLRYPGGKAKLAGFVQLLMKHNNILEGEYVEPYAGGAGVAIDLVFKRVASHVHINDLNYPVYSFWHSVLYDTERLCRLVSKAKLTVPTWRKHKAVVAAPLEHDMLDVGFSFFYLNRTNRSGIINGGVIGGLDQSGPWKIDARYDKNNLIKRIEQVAFFEPRISLYNMDALKLLQKLSKKLDSNSLIYLDPPYYDQGQRLYDNFYKPEDHIALAQFVGKLKTPWLVSYDDVPEIRMLYRKFPQTAYKLAYSAARVYTGKEVLIFSKKLAISDPGMLLKKSA